jgi:muconolactone delta-isomerase
MARLRTAEESMEFLVEFEINIPPEAAETEVERRESAEAASAAALVEQGHLLRVWKLGARNGQGSVLGLYRADSRAQLDDLLEALPLYEWMELKITPLAPHPNDPNASEVTGGSKRRRQ